jgi:DNA-binding XRE family transcriptional regulator
VLFNPLHFAPVHVVSQQRLNYGAIYTSVYVCGLPRAEVLLKLDRDKLLRARELSGYGLQKTAEEAGVSKNSVLRAEHGREIRPVTARKIAGALGVEVADLLEAGHPKGMSYCGRAIAPLIPVK